MYGGIEGTIMPVCLWCIGISIGRQWSDLFLFVDCSPWLALMSGCMSQSQALSFSLFSFVSIKCLKSWLEQRNPHSESVTRSVNSTLHHLTQTPQSETSWSPWQCWVFSGLEAELWSSSGLGRGPAVALRPRSEVSRYSQMETRFRDNMMQGRS